MLKTNKSCCDNCALMTFKGSASAAKLETHDGIEYAIIPVVAIVEGVLNNALVTAKEFGKYVQAWEGRPIPVDHPEINGMHVSSNLPDILASRVVGRFHNVNVKANKLVGEIWLDINAAIKKGFQTLVDRVKAGEVLEVSTAYFADEDKKSGTFNNESYSTIHINLRPDHLAILPNSVGACSNEDGCGTFRNEKEKKTFVQLLKTMAASIGFNLETNDMKKDELVTAIIANEANAFTNDDKEFLNGLTEDQLKKFAVNAEGDKDPEKMVDDEEEKAKAAKAKNNAQQSALSDDDRDALAFARNMRDDHKNVLITKLSANQKCSFTKDELKAMSVSALEKFDQMINGSVVDFSNRGMPNVNNSNHKEEPLQPSPVIFAKKKEA